MVMEHVHKYQKILIGARKVILEGGKRIIVKTAGREYMKCMVPDCKHFILAELAIGRQSVCWVCNHSLILNKENMTRVRPTHKDCRKKQEKVSAA